MIEIAFFKQYFDIIFTTVAPITDPIDDFFYKIFSIPYDLTDFIFDFLGVLPNQFCQVPTGCFFLLFFTLGYRFFPYFGLNKFVLFKQIYGVLTCIFTLFVAYQSGALVVIAFVLHGWVLYMILPFNSLRIITFISSFGFGIILHVWEMIYHPLQLRSSTALVTMVYILRLVGFTFSLYDGQRLQRGNVPKNVIHKKNRKVAIMTKVSSWQYFSYMFFVAGAMNVPILDYTMYQSFIENTDNTKITPFPIMRILNVIKWVTFYFSFYLIFAVLFQANQFYIHIENIQNVGNLKLFFMVMLTCMLVRYAIAGSLMFGEIVALCCGAGYDNTKSPGHEWDDTICMECYDLEFAYSFRNKIVCWNCSIEKWLRYNIYFRLPLRNRLFKRIITGILAAIWHGIYSGFTLMWITAMFISSIYINLYQNYIPVLFGHKEVKKVEKEVPLILRWILIILNQALHNWIMVSFVNLSWEESRYVFDRFLWAPQIFYVVIFLVLMIISPKLVKKLLLKKKEQ